MHVLGGVVVVDEVPSLDVVNKTVFVIVDSVAGDLIGIDPELVSKIGMLKVDTGIDDRDDDSLTASLSDVPRRLRIHSVKPVHLVFDEVLVIGEIRCVHHEVGFREHDVLALHCDGGSFFGRETWSELDTERCSTARLTSVSAAVVRIADRCLGGVERLHRLDRNIVAERAWLRNGPRGPGRFFDSAHSNDQRIWQDAFLLADDGRGRFGILNIRRWRAASCRVKRERESAEKSERVRTWRTSL